MFIPPVLPFEIKHYTDQANGDDSQHNSHDDNSCRCSGSRLICKSISVVDVKLFFLHNHKKTVYVEIKYKYGQIR